MSPYKPTPAQIELNRLKKLQRGVGVTGPKGKFANKIHARNVANMVKSGSLTQDVGPLIASMYPNLGRSGAPSPARHTLSGMYSNREGRDPVNSKLIKEVGNRRTGASHGTDSQWAWPKLHDPFEYWRERCVLPGQYITLLDGPKKVEDVKCGDQALTHMGRYRRVLDTGNQEYEGKVYQLKPRYRLPINITADHPIWTKQADGTGAFIHVQDLKPGDMILSPVDRHIEDKDSINIFDYIDESEWIVEDGLITRKASTGRSINPCPIDIKLTEDLLWLMGLYVAEGSTGGHENKTLHFSLNTTEFNYANRIVDIFKTEFALPAHIYDRENTDHTLSIEITSLPLSFLFRSLFGKGAYNKHFPIWAMFLPENKQKALLRGFLDGDGCYQHDLSSSFSSSKYLTSQVVLMMERNGFFPSIYRRTSKSFSTNTEGENLILSRTENRDFLRWLDVHQFDHIVEGTNKRGRKYPIQHVPEGVWVPVEKVTESDYKGTIYSLTITEDHSYAIEYLATRNTWWFNMEDPDEQREKIYDWCLDGLSNILMGDYTFKHIKDIIPGDEVIGFNYYQSNQNWTKSRLVKTKVVATKSKIADNRIKVTLASGRILICTDDHNWINYNYSEAQLHAGQSEEKFGKYTCPKIGAQLKFVVDPVDPLVDHKKIVAASYLGGMLDGDGHIKGMYLTINQSLTKNADICSQIERYLNLLDIPYTIQDSVVKDNWQTFAPTGSIKRTFSFGGPNDFQTIINFCNWQVSAKLKNIDTLIENYNFGSSDEIVSIEPLDPDIVYLMQTETGNYIADGYASKNCRLMYSTHYLVPGLIDIYTRWPLQDIEFVHKDKKLVDFYEEQFMSSSGLNYGEFLFDVGREFWLVGDAMALGSWNKYIGGWEADELINPNDVVVSKNRYLRMYQYHIKVPSEIKKLIDTREPAAEYRTLMELYPDMVQWARNDQEIPVSDMLMKQLKFKNNPWDEHGTPILLRAFRMLMLEESLNAAQDAVADRLYSPLILATLGLPDVDEDGPWIPTYDELQALRDDIGLAINSDFRLMVHHHGLEIKNAFGREAMPRFDEDFMRVEGNVLKVFGIGPAMLQGGTSNAGTYASSALNHELITNMLETYQINIVNFIRSRMEPVAEAQEFYEYERIGGKHVPVMETVLEVDEETGEERIVEKPKLAYPEIKLRQVSLKDENVERQFIVQLASIGFPVSYQSQAVNLPIDFKEELESRRLEKIDMVIAEQQYKKDLFTRLLYENLTCPMELVMEYQVWLAQYHPEKLVEPQNQQLMQMLQMGDPSMGMPTQDISSPPPTTDLSWGGNIPDEELEEGNYQDSEVAPAESYEGREMSSEASRIAKEASNLEPKISMRDDNFEYDFNNENIKSSVKIIDVDEEPPMPSFYGANLDFSTPEEFKQRRVIKVTTGSKVKRYTKEIERRQRIAEAIPNTNDTNGDYPPLQGPPQANAFEMEDPNQDIVDGTESLEQENADADGSFYNTGRD